MLFNSIDYLIFLPLVWLAYRALGHRWQNRLLLVASYIFYGSWDWRFLSLILLSTVVDFYCGAAMHRASGPTLRKRLLLLSLVVNLGLLGLFKYFGFFVDSFLELAAVFDWHVDAITMRLILPVGISFYTFQTLSYTIDIYRRQLEPEPRFLNFALFVAFFPQLVAGPIERARRLLPQIRVPRRLTTDDLAAGLWYLLWGYFLKVFVADNLAGIVDQTFAGDAPRPGLEVLIALYAFAFQIFGDFAGYSSIAIGTARLMGFRLTTNFLFPYFVTNPRDFWRNWHISLSSWLRDYLYIPLGGNRGSLPAVSRNLMLTMLLGGLWHGAAWTFVLWGAYQGALLMGHRLLTKVFGNPDTRPVTLAARAWLVIKILVMFHLTCLGWLIFRATSLEQIGSMLHSIVSGLSWPDVETVYSLLELAFHTWLMLLVQLLLKRAPEPTRIDSLSTLPRMAVVLGMVYSLLIWGNYGGGEFIYFQF